MADMEKPGDGGAIVLINDELTSTYIGPKNSPVPPSDVLEKPRIIGNELLVKPPIAAVAAEQMDELTSLEREIAKMHNAEECVLTGEPLLAAGCASDKDNQGNVSTSVGNSGGVENVNSQSVEGQTFYVDTKWKAESTDSCLEHEDLIAVLKGLDDTHNSSGESALAEGVTIEGEGEYQIMEVVDDDSVHDDNLEQTSANTATHSTSTYGTALLTAEEERALALEQMEYLKKNRRRRKQDIKPIKQAEPALDLVTALEADWTDTEEEVKHEMTAPNTGNSTVVNFKKETPSDSPLVTSVVVIQTPTPTTSSISSGELTAPAKTSPPDSDSKNNNSFSVTEKKTEEDSQTGTGFRRTRIIKRKIIWDPDAPETNFSYAKLLANNKNKVKQEPMPLPSTTITKGSTTIRPIKKESALHVPKKPQRPITPKEKLSAEPPSVVAKKSITLQKLSSVASEEKPPPGATIEKSASPAPDSSNATNAKRRSATPISNGPSSIKKKKISELDRLMSDEGAVNMLNSLEKLESALGSGETKPTRPMMRSRALTISEKVGTPPRKESTSPVKTPPLGNNLPAGSKGKRAAKSKASSSWDYVYKQKQKNLDDSMIIRRRSNSSYSSSASINRLSMDGAPSSSNSTVMPSESPPSSNTEIKIENDSPSATLESKKPGAGSKANVLPSGSGKSFEFAKPENKKAQRRTKSPSGTLANDLKKPAASAGKRNVRSPSNMDEKPSKASSVANSTSNKDKLHVSDVVVKKSSKVTQIIFSTNKAKISNTFTTQMLNKLADILDKLATDPDTYVTVITTNDTHFCQGVDLAELFASTSADRRKTSVKNLSSAVKRYLTVLAKFPKPLIAGVNGHVMNLGVMQLAFFDVVIAGEKCTYETPYVKLGQVPEGYSLWNCLNKIRGSFKTKLLWLSEKIQSTEAALSGLVNKITTPNKVNEEAVIIGKKIANMAPESYRVMKRSSSATYADAIDTSFALEFDTIADQWSSSEFLDNIKKYVDQGHF